MMLLIGSVLATQNYLEGFVWSGAMNRVTTGILIWPKVFLFDAENGDKMAILIMDTQGVFDLYSTTIGQHTNICFKYDDFISSDLQHLNGPQRK